MCQWVNWNIFTFLIKFNSKGWILLLLSHLKNYNFGGYRDSSVIKNTRCLAENPDFVLRIHRVSHNICTSNSRLPSSQASAFLWHIYIHAGKRVLHIKKKHQIFEIQFFLLLDNIQFLYPFFHWQTLWLISYFAMRNNICCDNYYFHFSMHTCFNFSQLNT